jgi:hypothetical protein
LVPEIFTVLPTAVGHVGTLQLADWVMLGGGGGGDTVATSAWASAAVASGVAAPPASPLVAEPDELLLPASTRADPPLLLPPLLLAAPLELPLEPFPVGADASGVDLLPLLLPAGPPPLLLLLLLLLGDAPGGSVPAPSGALDPHATTTNNRQPNAAPTNFRSDKRDLLNDDDGASFARTRGRDESTKSDPPEDPSGTLLVEARRARQSARWASPNKAKARTRWRADGRLMRADSPDVPSISAETRKRHLGRPSRAVRAAQTRVA